jgi:hypothetical protein
MKLLNSRTDTVCLVPETFAHALIAETVICRIFYSVCGTMKPRMTLREFKSADFVRTLLQLEGEDDVNNV